MNPLTNIKNQQKINERELQLGLTGHEKSWHSKYKNSAWIYFGGINFDLTEGDLLCVFSQYGEIVNINLVRDKKTGKSRGFGFVCYEDQRSTILSVDNLNGIKLCNRIIRVDHVENYRPPKDSEEFDELTKMLHEKGCAPEVVPELVTNEAPVNSDDEVDTHSAAEAKDKLDKAERKRLRKEKKRAKKAKKKEKKALKKAKKDKKRAKKANEKDNRDQDKEKDRGDKIRDRPNPAKGQSDEAVSSNDEDESSSSSSSDSEEGGPAKKRKTDEAEKISSHRGHSRSEHNSASSPGACSSRQRISDSKSDRPRMSHSERKRSPVTKRRSRTPDRYRRRSRSR